MFLLQRHMLSLLQHSTADNYKTYHLNNKNYCLLAHFRFYCRYKRGNAKAMMKNKRSFNKISFMSCCTMLLSVFKVNQILQLRHHMILCTDDVTSVENHISRPLHIQFFLLERGYIYYLRYSPPILPANEQYTCLCMQCKLGCLQTWEWLLNAFMVCILLEFVFSM